VVEVFKSPSRVSVPAFVDVPLPGGFADVGGYIAHVISDDVEPLLVGQTYVLFLEKREGTRIPTAQFALATYKADDVVEIRPAELRSRGRGGFAAALAAQSPASLRNQLRAKGGR
jgi:hypothetical protein